MYKYLILMACVMCFYSCSEENKREPLTSDSTVLGQVSNVQVETLPGAVMRYMNLLKKSLIMDMNNHITRRQYLSLTASAAVVVTFGAFPAKAAQQNKPVILDLLYVHNLLVKKRFYENYYHHHYNFICCYFWNNILFGL